MIAVPATDPAVDAAAPWARWAAPRLMTRPAGVGICPGAVERQAHASPARGELDPQEAVGAV